MKRLHVWSVVCLIVLIMAPLYADSVIVSVNGDKITKSELDRRAKILREDGNELSVLNTMIDEKILLQLVKKQGIAPTETQVNRKVEQARKSGAMTAALRFTGMTQAEYRNQIRSELAHFNLLTRGVTVTDKECQTEYNRNKNSVYTKPEMVKIRLISSSSRDTINKLYDRIKKGESFQSVAVAAAKNRASGVTVSSGSLIRGQGGIVRSLLDAAFKLKTNEVSQPIEIKASVGPVRWGIVQSLGRTQKTVISYAQAKDDIRSSLMVVKGSKRNNVQDMVAKARQKAKITVYSSKYKSLQQ